MPPLLPSTRLDQAIVKALKGAPLPGLSIILIDRHSSSPTFHHYGVAHLNIKAPEKSIPIGPKTLFPIGSSLSKNFTALLIAQLHCEGKIKLDEDIRTYVPDLRFKNSTQAITLRHLLSHTSGVREYRHGHDITDLIKETFVPKTLLNPLGKPKTTSPPSLEEYYCNTKNSPIWLAGGNPGTYHIKSHHNYGLAALCVEKVMGADLRTLIQSRIFKPLGMTSTDLVPMPDKITDLTNSFMWQRDGGFKQIEKGKRWDASSGRPRAVGGSAFSSAKDMARYLESLIKPENSNGVVTQSILDELLRPAYQKDHFLPAQCLSFAVESSAESGSDLEEAPDVAYVTCGQGMTWAGYQTAIVVNQRQCYAVGVLSNAGSNSYEISLVAKAALGECVQRAKEKEQGSISSSNSSSNSSSSTSPSPPVANLEAIKRHKALVQAMGSKVDGFQAGAVLWPQVTGVYQLPLASLSARVLWTLGGEVQVYVEDGYLRMRALWGPLRTKLFGKEKGMILTQAHDGHPLHYFVSGAARQVLSTPVNGSTDIVFDMKTREMHIGLVTLRRSPWYRSIRVWAMTFFAYQALTLVGKGKALDIITSMLLLG